MDAPRDPRTTVHRRTVSVPIFANSEVGLNINTPDNSRFEQKLTPPIVIPLDAKNPRMHLEQASLPYSMQNVRTGVNDSFQLSVNTGAFRYTYDQAASLASASMPADLTMFIAPQFQGAISYDGVLTIVTVPMSSLTVGMTVAQVVAVINTAVTTAIPAAVGGLINTGEGVGGLAILKRTASTYTDMPSSAFDVTRAEVYAADANSALGALNVQAHLHAGLAWGSTTYLYATHSDHKKYPYLQGTQGGSVQYSLSLEVLVNTTSEGFIGVNGDHTRAFEFWSPFTPFEAIAVSPGLYTMTDTMDEAKRAEAHHTTTDVALAIKNAVETGADAAGFTSRYHMKHTLLPEVRTVHSHDHDTLDVLTAVHQAALATAAGTLTTAVTKDAAAALLKAADDSGTVVIKVHEAQVLAAAALERAERAHSAYPLHVEPDLSISRVRMRVHNGVVVRVAGTQSLVGKLLGFATGDYEGNAAGTVAAAPVHTASSTAGVDDGTRALNVHVNICTGGYGADGRAGNSCIGSFPITHAPGTMISYAPTADPFRSRAPVAGSHVDHLVWELRDENGGLVRMQDEHWQALGVLSWDENERMS